MTIGARIKEERQRLGFNQTEFAALAGASRRAMVNWESDGAAPLVTALTAWAEAGVDALYVLTGRRTEDRPDNAVSQIEEQLADIRRDIVDPSARKFPGEDEQQAEKRILRDHAAALKSMLKYDRAFLAGGIGDEVEHLLDIIENPTGLSLYRAADRVQMRRKREETRGRLHEWLGDGPYEPDKSVLNLLTTLALEYGVPFRLLSELVYEMQEDIRSGPAAK